MGKGSSGGGNTNTVVQQQQPNPAVQAAYQNLTNTAFNQAQQPLQQYTGPLVSGFTPQQQQAFSTIQNLQGAYVPYLNAASDAFGQATQPLWQTLPSFSAGNEISQIGAGGLSRADTAQNFATTAGSQPIQQDLLPYANTASDAANNVGRTGQAYAANVAQTAQNLPGTIAPYTGFAASSAQNILPSISPYTAFSGQMAQNVPGMAAPYTGFAQQTAQQLQGQAAPYAGIAAGAAQGLNVNPAIAPALQNLSVPGYNTLGTYLSPYTQNVTQATQALFNQQNAQQQAQVAGSTVGAGAFGGDRQAVAQALTAQQQQLAQAPVLAQIQQQGFQQAQQELNAQQQLALQRGVSQGQLGLGAAQALTSAAGTQGQLGLGAGQLMTQAGLGAGQLGLGAGQLTTQAGLGAGQLGLGTAQALTQAQLGAGQLGLGAGQLTGQIGLGAGQLGLGAGQLSTQAGTAQGQLQLGAGSLMDQALAQQGQLGLGAGQLSLAGGQALMNEFNQQQQSQLAAEQANAWLASQAGFGLASLGQEAQGLGLAGAQANLQAGTLQQQLAQEQLNVPYEQFLAQQAYPYQQLNFLAPIVEGTGSLAGGTSSTTSPGPSVLGQVAGLGLTGLAGAGLLNQAGAFGPTGFLTGAGGLFGGPAIGSAAEGAATVGADVAAADAAIPAGLTAADAALAGLLKRGGRVGRQDGGGLGSVTLPTVPKLGLDYIVPAGPAVKGEGPPRAPAIDRSQLPQTPTLNQDLATATQLVKLGGFGKDQPSSLAIGGVPHPHLGGFTQLGGSLAHMGFGRPRLQDGGMEDPLLAAAPLDRYGPNAQTAYQQFEQLPLEKLQEISTRVPPASVQGQMVQRALMAKRMTPGAGLPPIQMPSVPTNYLPFQPGTTATGAGMAEGGEPGYVTEDEIDPHPVVDKSGETVVVRYPSEKKSLDLGLPSLRGRQQYADGGPTLSAAPAGTADQQASAVASRLMGSGDFAQLRDLAQQLPPPTGLWGSAGSTNLIAADVPSGMFGGGRDIAHGAPISSGLGVLPRASNTPPLDYNTLAAFAQNPALLDIYLSNDDTPTMRRHETGFAAGGASSALASVQNPQMRAALAQQIPGASAASAPDFTASALASVQNPQMRAALAEQIPGASGASTPNVGSNAPSPGGASQVATSAGQPTTFHIQTPHLDPSIFAMPDVAPGQGLGNWSVPLPQVTSPTPPNVIPVNSALQGLGAISSTPAAAPADFTSFLAQHAMHRGGRVGLQGGGDLDDGGASAPLPPLTDADIARLAAAGVSAPTLDTLKQSAVPAPPPRDGGASAPLPPRDLELTRAAPGTGPLPSTAAGLPAMSSDYVFGKGVAPPANAGRVGDGAYNPPPPPSYGTPAPGQSHMNVVGGRLVDAPPNYRPPPPAAPSGGIAADAGRPDVVLPPIRPAAPIPTAPSGIATDRPPPAPAAVAVGGLGSPGGVDMSAAIDKALAGIRQGDQASSFYNSPWMPIMAAGLGMMASPSHFPLQQVGQGGLEGLKMLAQQQKEAPENELRRAQAQTAAVNAQLLPLRMQAALADMGGNAVPTGAQPGSAVAPLTAATAAPPVDVTKLNDPRGVVPLIQAAAAKYGVDPNVALRVAQSEGLSDYVGDKGTSFGAFQLHIGGGLGDLFKAQTGLDPSDPKNEPAMIDWSMRNLASTGWEPYHGAARVGIADRQGIPGGSADQLASAQQPHGMQVAQNTVPFGMQGTDRYDQLYRSINQQIATAQQDIDRARRLAVLDPEHMAQTQATISARQGHIAQLNEALVHAWNQDPRIQAPLEAAKEAARQDERYHTIPGAGGAVIRHGQVVAQTPQLLKTIDPATGLESETAVYPAVAGAVGTPMAGGAMPSGAIGPEQMSRGVPVALGPGQAVSLKQRAEDEQKARDQTLKDAQAAQNQMATLNRMKEDSKNIYTGPFADQVGKMQSFLRLVNPAYNEAVASREDFLKNGGAFVRQATHDLSPRAAYQEVQFVSSTLPNIEMSPQGLQMVLNEYQGLNDYKIAKARAQQQWEMTHGGLGHVEGFESFWQAQAPVTPYTFILKRMDPDESSKLFAKWGQTDEGRAELQKLREQYVYASQNGLLP